MVIGFIALAGAILGLLVYWRNQWLSYDIRYLAQVASVGIFVKRSVRAKKWVIDYFEENVERMPTKSMVLYEDQSFTYEEVNKKANQVANFAKELGWKQGDVVALVIQNEPAFVWTYLGLAKCGVVCSMINTNLRTKSLQHCFTASDAKAAIVGQSPELRTALEEVEIPGLAVFYQGETSDQVPSGWRSFDDAVNKASDKQPPKSARSDSTGRTAICYIFTSGTTGLPKPALFAQDRALKATCLMAMSGVTEKDVIYTALPLYHSAGLGIALGTTMRLGTTLALRKKFSASKFWDDCRKYNVTVVQYIGELCRFLLSTPEHEKDKEHSVRLAHGNGLRADIWPQFQKRFGISNIVDFYAATEGNIGFINIFNKEGSIGRCSPIYKTMFPIRFLKYDLNTAQPVRDSKGRCMEVPVGEPGLMVCGIKKDLEFDGYVGKKELTGSKIIRNVFREGDAYFNSGDLLTADDEYFLYFSDRIGDTFRWKGENVSTTEVSNVICELAWIEDANVYGVPIPGFDGKCGMAALTLQEGHTLTSNDLGDLYRHCAEFLAAYASPRFLRIQREMQMTSTLKQQKTTLVKEAFDPEKCKEDALYYMNIDKKTFSLINADAYEAIVSGKVRL